ncbi:TPA: cell division protein FtsK, partial [Staphylococcus pseudintermedius]|nr:cell division protein FtsK [Staphylococcus pseudintermedius]
MAMNEIALFKGVRIQPYHKYVDFIVAGAIASAFLIYRIYVLIQSYNEKYSTFDVRTFFPFVKSFLIPLVIGTAIVFLIVKLIAHLLIRFKVKDLAEMIETQGFHNRTVIKKRTEFLDIDYRQTEYDYYPTLFYKRGKKSFILHIKKDGSRFQNDYLELETIIEPMFHCELVEKRHIGRYLRYEFMPLKFKKRIIMDNHSDSESKIYDTKIKITEQISWNFVKAPHGLVTGITGGGK